MRKQWGRPGSLFIIPKTVAVKKTAWWQSALRKFRFFGFLRGICTFIGVIFLLSMTSGFFAGIMMGEQQPLPEQMILTLKIDDGLQEVSTGDGFFELPSFASTPLSVRDMVRALDFAATDPNVKALAISLEGGGAGVSQVQELRAAIKRFRASGKPSYVFSPSYAEAGGGMGTYYLASAFEQIWIQPVGFVDLPGINAEMPFAKAALNKVGINPEFYQRKEYKSVMESFSRESMSPENREMMQSLMQDILEGIITDVASDRNLSPEAVRLAVDQALFTDQEALKAKLVDRIDYGDVLFSEIRKDLTGDPEDENLKLYEMGQYFHHALPGPDDDAPMVGFVHAVGNIVPNGESGGISDEIIAADRVAAAIMKGVRDKNIMAIVLRIDSPGGSPTASETIRRAVERSMAQGKPVIVSMGSMAGSGGYWIAVDADRIYALPSTLTGSIGVASGKFEVGELMRKIGVTWEGVRIGKNADLNSFTVPFSQSADERMNATVDSIYAAFTGRVEKGRNLTSAQVEEIARGRVWTGRQAVKLGLVDTLGGLDMALDYAATLAGVENRSQIHLVELPRPKTAFDRVFELLDIEVAISRFMNVVTDMLAQKVGVMSATSVTVDPVLRSVLD